MKIETIRFTHNGNTLAGTLYLPADTSQPLPAVVVTGAWTSVKEQMPKTYAEQLAAQGYASLTFDFTGWGESDGDNRYLESPANKTADIKAAVAFLQSRDDVDSSRIGGLGICASAGYMTQAYSEAAGLKTIALVAPWMHNSEIATAVYGGEDSVQQLIQVAENAQAKFEQSGELTTIPAASSTDDSALMYQVPYYTEAGRGQIPAYDNQFNLASWKPWLTFDAIALAGKIPGPMAFVHSEAAAIPQGIKAFAEAAGDRVQGTWLDNVIQFDFYDQPEPVAQAINAVTQHYAQHL